ncbi:bifunctional 3-(3-hydroxy-phenyl)propionate/3-hydroxycinnamic acid hydroxylase [Parasphingorhabdus sp.]|uniref:bifunctional 3-(3-hydroxy-phenyl)propionate/3-hydroxycinnamic acid hydroxylase MhpA n=1 Tax=Parasphingorhabdus sp. TaxID=2709688 RepID=UPI003D2CDC0B
MTLRDEHDCDVLIAGGGPTGVTLGLLLAQYGVSVIIAEKEANIFPLPRAAHIDHEVMRILQGIGVADAVMATCRQSSSYDFLNAAGDVLLRFDGLNEIGSGGWPKGNFIHQPSVEAALRHKLAQTAGIELRSQWEVTHIEDHDNGISVQCLTPDGQGKIAARYLVGADGARSPVRQKLGVEFEDLNFDEPWLVVDAIVHDFERLPKVNLQICNPERPTTCVLMGEGRHRWEFMIKPGETAEQVADEAFIEKLLEPWDVKGAITIERKAVYRFNARVAEVWRKGHILLAGDAAHQTPPFAGQGMCAGMRDAANLGWKLATVIMNGGPDSLLDSYQREREPHVRATIGMAMMMGQTVCITDPQAAAMRDQQMLETRAAGMSPDSGLDYPPIADGLILKGSPGAGSYFPQPTFDREKLDDLLGAATCLISRMPFSSATANPELHVVDLTDSAIKPFAASISDWLDAHQSDAAIVRPDRYVFGLGEPGDLVESFNQITREAPARVAN